MRYYVAPLEGITKSLYRRVHRRFFPGAHRYFSPFLSPTRDYRLTQRELRELLPDLEEGVPLVPQLLVNDPEPFVRTALDLRDLGFGQVDLNLGCPSRTVTAKRKGSGLLGDLPRLEALLGEIFDRLGDEIAVSVKTRMGSEDPREFEALIPLFNRFPLCEVTVHARVREDFYRRPAVPQLLSPLAAQLKAPFCYNGDLLTPADGARLLPLFPTARAVMVGRGLIADPALIGELEGQPRPDKEVYRAFHQALVEGCLALGWSQRAVLCHMKEIWDYMGELFQGMEDLRKPLRKTLTVSEYQGVVNRIFALPLKPLPQ